MKQLRKSFTIVLLLMSIVSSASAMNASPFIQMLQTSLSQPKITSSVFSLKQLGQTVPTEQYTHRIESAIPLLQFYARELNASGLPSYYAIIPLVESMNRLDALSPRGALGVWQLMPETAVNFGARVNQYIDERQSIILSTRYAVRFIKTLEAQLEHPIYVLAAYNWGPANVSRVKSSFLYPEQLLTSQLVPAETKQYVISILGYWDTILKIQETDRLMIYPNVDYLATIIMNNYPFLEIDNALFSLLNHPHYNGSDRLIPSDYFHAFYSNSSKTRNPITSRNPSSSLSQLGRPVFSGTDLMKTTTQQDQQCTSLNQETAYQIYVVSQNDTLENISRKLNVPSRELLQTIPKGKISPGNVLLIPENFPKRCS